MVKINARYNSNIDDSSIIIKKNLDIQEFKTHMPWLITNCDPYYIFIFKLYTH